MAQEFEISGPHVVPLDQRKGGRTIDRKGLGDFWQEQPEFAEKRGCYVFGIRAGKGYTPIYVGKTTKSFQQECFTSHKLQYYNESLADYKRGTPVMFLLGACKRRGRPPGDAIDSLERYLITIGEQKNPNLANVQNRATEKWVVRGFLRSGKGRPTAASRAFQKLMVK